MSGEAKFLAIDLGASNGRVLLGKWDGRRFGLEEVHRLPNGPVRIFRSLFWDATGLWREIQTGISRYAAAARVHLSGISVDGWGVDFVLLDRLGRLLFQPYHYRDRRTEGIPEKVFAKVPAPDVFLSTGVQSVPLNTLYQLYSMVDAGDDFLARAETLLMIPDLFHYWMTGERASEYTNVTTTQMYDVVHGDWAHALLRRLDIPARILPRLVHPGTRIGELGAELMEECGLSSPVPVIAGATHDTASAVAAVPDLDSDSAFLSTGTWCLMGVELAAPIVNDAVLAFNFANEGGVAGTTLLLRNVCGLWLLQESLRRWQRDGRSWSWDEILVKAAEQPALRSIVDPDARDFTAPQDMPAAIRCYCATSGQSVPESEGAIARCAIESISLKCRWVLDRLEQITGRTIGTIRIVGGGVGNALLCQSVADATNRTVVAGPFEAAALGNVMMQAIATGALSDVAAGRKAIAASIDPRYFEPARKADWDSAYDQLQTLLGDWDRKPCRQAQPV